MRFANAIFAFFLRLGLPIGRQALLTVAGRKSGLPRTTPVALNRRGDEWLLVSVWGEVDWVKNLRASGSAIVTKGRREIAVAVRELTEREAAAVLKELVSSIGVLLQPVIGRYFEAGPEAPIEKWREEAERHPVFLLTPT
jgi:deazaflavin-dependent oxidoreductase (nitroreductase family)